MGIWIGIDGGGTKTEFLSVNETGKLMAFCRLGGTYYHQIGIEAVGQILLEGIETVSANNGPILGICFGMPGYGESGNSDEKATAYIREKLPLVPLHIVNDVEVGWAGSLALEPGVNIVAGTGAIAYGRDVNNKSLRCGGWAKFFSDEGSCYWLGRRTLELFSKESDGRLPKGALYFLFREKINICEDWEVNCLAREVYEPARERTAQLQEVLACAAREGDIAALSLYEEAGGELAMSVRTILKRLYFPDKPRISYSGGLFKTGELIMKPFKRALKMDVLLQKPLLSPAQGAVLLAAERFMPEVLHSLKEGMILKKNQDR